MKSQHILATVTIGALMAAGLSTASAQANATKPTVITPPAVKDGSNWSRAPFPAQRQHDDVKSPDGVAIDQTLPPNTPATNVEPPVPAPRIAIMQPATAPATTTTVVATAPVEPVLTPTGRSSAGVAMSLDATSFAPTIRSATHESRNQVIADIESRLKTTESAIDSVRGTASEMSATGRQSFDTASKEVKDKAKALRKSINNARKASASEWENARAQLAADFDAYAAAVGQIDSVAR